MEVLAFFPFFFISVCKHYPVRSWNLFWMGLSPERANWAKREKPRRNHRRLQVGKNNDAYWDPPKKQPRVSLPFRKNGWVAIHHGFFDRHNFLGNFILQAFFETQRIVRPSVIHGFLALLLGWSSWRTRETFSKSWCEHRQSKTMWYFYAYIQK